MTCPSRTAALLRQAIRATTEEDKPVIEYDETRYMWVVKLKGRQGKFAPFMEWFEVPWWRAYLRRYINKSILDTSPIYSVEFVYADNPSTLAMLLQGFSKWMKKQHPGSLVLVKAYVTSEASIRRYFERRGLLTPKGHFILGMRDGRVLPFKEWYRPPKRLENQAEQWQRPQA